MEKDTERQGYLVIEEFIDREIEAMDESGKWSTHAVSALLALQARIDEKLAELGKPS